VGELLNELRADIASKSFSMSVAPSPNKGRPGEEEWLVDDGVPSNLILSPWLLAVGKLSSIRAALASMGMSEGEELPKVVGENPIGVLIFE